jgi:tetratricopeptide (TPR) repeat protein
LYLPAGAVAAEAIQPGDWAQTALTEALSVSLQIEDPYRRAQALTDIGSAQLDVGAAAEGRETLGLALATTGKIGVEALKSWVLHDIAVAQMKALHGADDILALVDRIQELRARDAALAALARRLKSRDPGAGVPIARRIHNAALQGRVLWEIAVTQAEKGYPEEGLATARSIVSSSTNALALGDVAAAYAAQGDVSEAKSLAARIRNDAYRARAAARIAAAQAARGDFQGALATAQSIEHKLSRAQALAVIATARAERGNVTGARELLDLALSTVRGERRAGVGKAATFGEIARAQLVISDTQAAQRTIAEMVNAARPSRAQEPAAELVDDIARLQAKAGDYAAARSTASLVGDTGVRALLLRDIMTEHARSGDITGALDAVRQLEPNQSAALAISAIVAIQAAHDGPDAIHATLDSILTIIRRIDTAPVRAGALASLASALLRAQDLPAAQKVYEEAMSVAASESERPLQVSAFVQIADNLGYGLD